MVIRSLPKKLVQRLRVANEAKGNYVGNPNGVKKNNEYQYSNFQRLMARLKNIDHRRDRLLAFEGVVHKPGQRVRELDVSRNYPRVGKVALKLVHHASAKQTIGYMKKIVLDHNKMFKPKTYLLKSPIAYAIGIEEVVMAKADFPNIEEIISERNLCTKRGKTFFKKLEKKGATVGKLSDAYRHAQKNFVKMGANFHMDHWLVTDYVKGKFVFTPLMDLQ